MKQSPVVGILAFIVVVAGVIGGVMFGIPAYRIWQLQQSGRAQLAQAEYTRQILVFEAQAELEAARLLAEAELVRAEGAAAAMKAVHDTLTHDYLMYLWIRTMTDNENIIYLPVDFFLPVFDMNR